MEIIFLGTGSMVPTKKRNHQGILVSYKNEKILIDCGEGIQRQLRLARISASKITKILITHWHGDHVLGLPGLIQTMGFQGYSKELEIYGPRGSKNYFRNMFNGFVQVTRVKYRIHEINKKVIFDSKDFKIEAMKMEHGCPCYGYSIIEKDKRKINLNYLKKYGIKKHPILKKLQEGKSIVWKGKKIDVKKATFVKKGKKITIVTDTKKCVNAVKLANDSDLLICEATHMDDLRERSESVKHMTTLQAVEIAKKAKVEKLIVTHISQRYRTSKEILKELRSGFKKSDVAEDFMKVEV